LRVLELRFGAEPNETVDIDLPISADDVTGMGLQQLQLLAARLVIGEPPEDTVAITQSEPATN